MRLTDETTLPPAASDSAAEILARIGEVVLSFDEDGRLRYLNHAWERLTGRPVAACLQRPFTDFLHPQDASEWPALLHGALRSGEPTWLRLTGPDAELLWCELRLGDHQPGTTLLYATLCDITPQVRQEQRRAASLRSLESLINRVPAMLYRSRNNVDYTMEYISEGCVHVTGFDACELLEQSQLSFGKLIHPDDASHVWAAVQDSLQSRSPFSVNYRFRHADGHWCHLHEQGRGIISASGEVLGIEGLILRQLR
ncbi:PAS domain-containing protein [Granulosicoccaceae sp. 1_MG-2023]|nr:PAS domain-containing protein [Granulosicoccaceae sp. 1_MG-2023]